MPRVRLSPTRGRVLRLFRRGRHDRQRRLRATAHQRSRCGPCPWPRVRPLRRRPATALLSRPSHRRCRRRSTVWQRRSAEARTTANDGDGHPCSVVSVGRFPIRLTAATSSAHAISTNGRWLHRMAVGWLAWELTESTSWLGIVGFADAFPMVFVSLLAGALGDRMGYLRVIRFSQFCAGCVTALFAALTPGGRHHDRDGRRRSRSYSVRSRHCRRRSECRWSTRWSGAKICRRPSPWARRCSTVPACSARRSRAH